MFTVNIVNAPAGSTSADPTLLLLPTLAHTQAGPPRKKCSSFATKSPTWRGAWKRRSLSPVESAAPAARSRANLQLPQGLIPGGGTHPTRRGRSLSGDELGAGELDSIHPGSRAEQQSRDPVAACRDATLLVGDPRLRKKSSLRPRCCGRVSTSPLPRHTSCTKKKCPGLELVSRSTTLGARWTQGQVYTWLRARKQTGRGEATSGLSFDRLVDKNQAEG